GREGSQGMHANFLSVSCRGFQHDRKLRHLAAHAHFLTAERDPSRLVKPQHGPGSLTASPHGITFAPTLSRTLNKLSMFDS
ncbi:MAG: hypothetical protein ACRC8G_12710, partial [Plesiomonas shigelloides]